MVDDQQWAQGANFLYCLGGLGPKQLPVSKFSARGLDKAERIAAPIAVALVKEV